jgi:hypothetical protein
MGDVTEIKKADNEEKEAQISIKLNEAERLAIRGLLQQVGDLQNRLAMICKDVAESKGEIIDGEIHWQTDSEIKILTGIKNK